MAMTEDPFASDSSTKMPINAVLLEVNLLCVWLGGAFSSRNTVAMSFKPHPRSLGLPVPALRRTCH